MKPANIKVTIHLWNNDLNDAPGECWDSGQVSVQRGQNPDHPDVMSGNAVLFNSPDALPAALLKALALAGIEVHSRTAKETV